MYTVKAMEVWAGDIMNRPGMLARVIEAMTTAGADMEFMIARRVSENTSRVFLSPIRGKKVKQAAQDVGLMPASGLQTIRVEGPDRPGLGAALTRAIASAGVNLRGASAAVIGKRAVFNFGVSTAEDAKAAIKAVKPALKAPKKK